SLRDQCCQALFLVLLMLSSVPEGLVVVCVREDGHVALEIVGAPAPPAESAAASGSDVIEATPCACGDRCGPCRDSKFGASPQALLRAARVKSAASPAPATAIYVAMTQPPAAAVVLLGQAHRGRSPSAWLELQDTV